MGRTIRPEPRWAYYWEAVPTMFGWRWMSYKLDLMGGPRDRMNLEEGLTFTRWGARRAARRSAQRHRDQEKPKGSSKIGGRV